MRRNAQLKSLRKFRRKYSAMGKHRPEDNDSANSASRNYALLSSGSDSSDDRGYFRSAALLQKTPTESNSQAAVGHAAPIDYSSRIGVAVRTASRTCLAIKNEAIAPNSPVTLVLAVSPQKFVEAQISGPSASPCPVTKEVAAEMRSTCRSRRRNRGIFPNLFL